MMKGTLKWFLALALGSFVVLLGCNKTDSNLPHNPYDDVVYETQDPPVDTTQKNTLVWLQREVFSARCAIPGCHDGHFEPNFTTLSTTYSTLVYHPIVKNNSNEDFTYRVVPYDTAASVLYERLTNCCFVNTNDRMPQDVIGVPLQDTLIEAIEAWIMDGARDMFGQVSPFPDKKPVVLYYVAVSTDYLQVYSGTENRIDTVYYNPFVIANGTVMNVGVFITDDATPVADMTHNKLITSYDPNDFSSGAPGYKVYTPIYLSFGQNEFWQVTINTADFSPGNVVYMRYYTNDGEHTDDVEMPNDDLNPAYTTFWSFYTTP